MATCAAMGRALQKDPEYGLHSADALVDALVVARAQVDAANAAAS